METAVPYSSRPYDGFKVLGMGRAFPGPCPRPSLVQHHKHKGGGEPAFVNVFSIFIDVIVLDG